MSAKLFDPQQSFVPQMCEMEKGLVGIPAFFQTEHTESTLTDVA